MNLKMFWNNYSLQNMILFGQEKSQNFSKNHLTKWLRWCNRPLFTPVIFVLFSGCFYEVQWPLKLCSHTKTFRRLFTLVSDSSWMVFQISLKNGWSGKFSKHAAFFFPLHLQSEYFFFFETSFGKTNFADSII